MKIFYWVKNLNHHHLYTMASVEEQSGESVTYIITDIEDPVRKRQGWHKTDLSDKDVIILDKQRWQTESVRILGQNKNAVHIFFGFWQERRWFLLILYGLLKGIKIAILQEPYNESAVGYQKEELVITSKLKVIFRPLLYRMAASVINIASLHSKPPCILPISLIAHQQFIEAGFNIDSLFPFGYFVQRLNSVKDKKPNEFIRLVFVASLLKIKGLDVAIKAINNLSDISEKITLDVYGPGDPKLFIPNDSEKVQYKGVIPTEQAQNVIANYDILLLPSRHDGWGLVVNEALLQGVPAIVSDRVGAKCLIERSGAGIVFRNEDTYQLSNILADLMTDPKKMADMCNSAAVVGNQILPQNGARYLLDVFGYYFFGVGVKPNAIWTG